ncbi:DNA-binding response regulator [Bacteroides sp. GD17]|uniref:response regulator transcription factor n=1 Tax=Bacteroides sp. GD17 TaxID=3139826 RepID=UPI0025D4C470|nr:DNA-binding response regulator [uncultured Bacteroides sp.]
MMIVLLCLLILVVVALAFACVSLFLRLKTLEQRIPAQSMETERRLDMQVPLSLTEAEVPLVSIPPLGATPETAGEEEGRQDMPKHKIVVVDDDAGMRDYLGQQLSADFEVLVAENGEQGLALIRENCPAIVISDVRMPVMTGYELCHALRQNVETSRIPVILISFLSERENIIYGLEAGATDYIVKPFDMTVLHTRIRSILKRNQEQLDKAVMAPVLSKMEYKNRQDKELMDRVVAIIKERLLDSDFSINELCQELDMSRSTVYGKIKVLTGHGLNDLIKTVRLNEAYELLLSRELNVSEVAYRVGFSDPKYFSTCFKKQFGISPTKV